MMYLIFGDGALHGSTPYEDEAFRLAEKAGGEVGHENVGILRLDGARWVTKDDKGAVSEALVPKGDYRPLTDTDRTRGG